MNNDMIEIPIYFTSNMHIVRQDNSNTTSFPDYMKNAVIKIPIYFTSNMHIVRQDNSGKDVVLELSCLTICMFEVKYIGIFIMALFI
jgi:hypothetical protein